LGGDSPLFGEAAGLGHGLLGDQDGAGSPSSAWNDCPVSSDGKTHQRGPQPPYRCRPMVL